MRRARTWVLFMVAALLAVGGLGIAGTATDAGAASQAETYQGVPVGLTAEGHPFRGDPNAPLTVVEYSDYLCPFCERHVRQTVPTLLERYVRTGKVKYVVRDFPLVQLHPTAPRGAAAAGCVAEQAAALFWAMNDKLFQAQPQWSRLPDPSAFLAKLAQEVGADPARYEACMSSGRQEARVQQSVAAATALGFNGTPTFQFVHEASGKIYPLSGAHPVEVFTHWIDDLLAGKEPPKDQQAEPAKPAQRPELPFWAKPEGLAPDPKRPGFTVAGDPYKGSPDAKLVIVEFGDFQCPSCQRHALTTQPELDKRFVETGQVLWVAKQFPLAMHPNAAVAAAAANCAGDQGKFWPMHHSLFERADQWSTSDDPDAAFTAIAVDLALDKSRFATCLAGRGAMQRVLRDVYESRFVGIRNVPSFVVLSDKGPVVMTGSRPTEQFATVLQRFLDSKAATSAAGQAAERR